MNTKLLFMQYTLLEASESLSVFLMSKWDRATMEMLGQDGRGKEVFSGVVPARVGGVGGGRDGARRAGGPCGWCWLGANVAGKEKHRRPSRNTS